MASNNPNENKIIQDALDAANNDDFTNSGPLSHWWYSGYQQEKEFGQQVALQQMQNEWNSAQAQMERLKEAGVNPNLAARGLNDQSTSVSAPPSAIGANSSLPGQLASAAGVGVQAIEAAGSLIERFALLPERKKNIVADTQNKLMAAGVDELTSKIMTIQLPFVERGEQLRIATLLGNLMKIDEESENLRETRQNIIKQRSVMDADINLKGSQVSLNEKLALQAQVNAMKIDEDRKLLAWRNECIAKYNADPNMPIYNQMLSARMAGDTASFNAMLQGYYDIIYNDESARHDVIVENAFDEAYRTAKGKFAAEARYAPFLNKLAAQKEMIVRFFDSLIQRPENLKQAMMEFIQMIADIPYAMQIDEMEVNKAERPTEKSRRRDAVRTHRPK